MISSELLTSHLLRAVAALVLARALLALVSATPVPVRLHVVDAAGRPLEGISVRVVVGSDPRRAVTSLTDVEGNARAEISGAARGIDVIVNPAIVPPASARHVCPPPRDPAGPNYDTAASCGLKPRDYRDGALVYTLREHLPTRTVCRLTGRDAPNGPYQYLGQDSAITLPIELDGTNGRERKLLWWFGDTIVEPTRRIFVQNKMALSDVDDDPSDCIALTYLDAEDAAALPVAPLGVPIAPSELDLGPPQPRALSTGDRIVAENTVWLDVPLVIPGAEGRREPERFGQAVFQPSAGDQLHITYLSVRDMPVLFRINFVGIASYRSCHPDCAGADPTFARRLARPPDPIWFGPPARNRAPEGTAYVDGDDYVLVKVADRRPYCAAPPYRVDCSDRSPCARGVRCIRPGRFCSSPPYVACEGDADCDAGRCSVGGVIAMRVARDRVLDPSAYRYWDARAGRFAASAAHDPDAVLVDAEISNSVSAIWSTYLGRWVMIHNYERPAFSGHSTVALRTAPSLLGPWTDAVPIMENVGGQKSYNPRFLATPTSPHAGEHLVYWTATYDTFDARQPQHGMPFDYNVFLYETDLSKLLGRDDE